MNIKDLYFTGHMNYELKEASHVGFESAASPKQLLTRQDIAITSYPNWDRWQKHFGVGRQYGPQFMRDGKWELSSGPYKTGFTERCRSEGQGSNRRPSGCGP